MKKDEELPKVEPVKIKPLFGIKPNIWVSACYLISVILLVFLICFLPDILHGFRLVNFTAEVGNAAVYVDDEYTGGTPFTAKVYAGNHVAEFKVENQTIDTVEFNVKRPVFLGWLFPRKVNVESNMTINKNIYEKLCTSFLKDVANYSAILSYDKVHNYPQIFTNYADTISTMSGLNETDYQNVLFCACSFITTEEMLSDAENAYRILNLDFDFSEIKQAVKDKTFKTETENLLGLSMRYFTTLETEYFTRSGVGINGFTFDNFPVSEAMYYYFVQENPEWSVKNKEDLINKGLVDEYYLAGVNLSPLNTSRPVRNISYYAAEAFCSWVSKISGFEVYIPEELQWIKAAAFSNSGFQKTLVPVESTSGPSGVLGSVWEMTSTPYVPLLSLFDYSVYKTLKKYNVRAEVIIKGGSYVSDPDKTTLSTIGTTSLSLCSDYMGFRLAWR